MGRITAPRGYPHPDPYHLWIHYTWHKKTMMADELKIANHLAYSRKNILEHYDVITESLHVEEGSQRVLVKEQWEDATLRLSRWDRATAWSTQKLLRSWRSIGEVLPNSSQDTGRIANIWTEAQWQLLWTLSPRGKKASRLMIISYSRNRKSIHKGTNWLLAELIRHGKERIWQETVLPL